MAIVPVVLGAVERPFENLDGTAANARREQACTRGDGTVLPMRQRRVYAAIAVGGALGSAARYGVAQLITVAPDTFPWATLWTNISGSFVLGVVLALVLERFPPTRYVRPFAATGFLGAYTTYSTFAVETDVLVKDGHAGVALAYVVVSLAAGLSAVWLGMWMARGRWLPGRPEALD